MQDVERLRYGIHEWLVHHRLDGDTAFYAPDEWLGQGGQYFGDSKLVLVFENGLYMLINGYSINTDLYNEFDRFVRGFGYYFELGDAWNMGFYPLEGDSSSSPDYRRYAEKLRDPRWFEKRDHIRKRAVGACEECGSTSCIEIHHCCYVRGWQPWEYPDYLLKCVCRECHERRAAIEMRMNGFLSSLSMGQMEILRESLANHAFPCYGTDAVLEFIAQIRGNHEKMDAAYVRLKECLKQ